MTKIINLISLAVSLYYIIVLWKIAKKAGQPGISLIIPIYSNFTWPKVLGLDTIWCIMSFIPSIMTKMYSDNLGIYLLSGAFSIVIYCYYCFCLAKRFNKGILFAIGLILLNPVFLGILAFNKKCWYSVWN